MPGVNSDDFFSEKPEESGEPPDAALDHADVQWWRRRRHSSARRRSFWRELPILVLVALVLSLTVQTFIARVYVVPSESMEPTLHGCGGCSNDRIFVDKVSYRFTDPRAGDVVVFRGPDNWTSDFTSARSGNAFLSGLQQVGSLIGLAPPDERDFVKRVVATGGQTVQCCDEKGRVLVDGAPLDEPYVVNDFPFLPGEQTCTTPLRSGRCFDPFKVPAGSLWVMGDNRSNSADSRRHGAVPVTDIIGKARLVVLPVTRWQVVNAPRINSSAGGP